MDGGAKFENPQPQPDARPLVAASMPDTSSSPPSAERPALSEREIMMKAAAKNREVRMAVLEGKYNPSQIEDSDLPEDWKNFLRNVVTVVRTDMDATKRVIGTAQANLKLVEAKGGKIDDEALAREVHKMACGPLTKVNIKGKIDLIRRPSVSILIVRDPSDLDKIGVKRDPNAKTEIKAEGTYLDRHIFYLSRKEHIDGPLIVVYSRKPVNELDSTISEELLHHTYRHTVLAAAKAEKRHCFEEEGNATASIRLGFDIQKLVRRATQEGVTEEIRSKFERLLDECGSLAESFAANELFANIANSPMAKMGVSSGKDKIQNTLTTGMDIEILSGRSAYSPWSVLFPDRDRFPEELNRMVGERVNRFNSTVRQAVDSAEDGFLSMLYLRQEARVFDAYYLLLQKYPMSEWESRLGALMEERLSLYREYLKDIDPLKFQCVMTRKQGEALGKSEGLSKDYLEGASRFREHQGRIADLYLKISNSIASGMSPKDAIASVKGEIDRLKVVLRIERS